MAVTLHRCSIMWIKGPHPCWKVQKALEETGTPYELVKHPSLRGRRDALEAKSGQRKLPVIELEDGRVLREESSELAARIRRGELSAQPPGGAAA